jgi:outer membrane lipoprotein-sorting protein
MRSTSRIGRWSGVLLAAIAMSIFAVGQTDASKSGGALDHVLTQMDTAATNFRTTEATFAWDQYQKVINETEMQKGKIYFRRQGKEIQMFADVMEPDAKSVLFTGGKIQLYQPKIDQVTEYTTGKNRSDLESYLVLGFGGSGHDLLKSYDVKYLGEENALDVKSAKLELIPKSDKVKNTIARILLWIDPARGISVQQQFFEPSGDYRLAKYSDIRVNQKLADSVFKLKTTGKTKVVSPQG